LDQEKITWNEVATLGDDLPEMGLIQRVALFGAVADASHHLAARAHYVCRTPAGRGAVAEFLELILRREGTWKIEAERLGVSL
jgi:3-deoxy-D-manno-octulosonate 8-phosphate phosphatase (KDO 8-P phosphatase)